MTLEQIKTRIAYIEASKDDDATAHRAEDELHKEFIDYVRTTSMDPLGYGELKDRQLSEKAALVLSTNNINFARWYA